MFSCNYLLHPDLGAAIDTHHAIINYAYLSFDCNSHSNFWSVGKLLNVGKQQTVK